MFRCHYLDVGKQFVAAEGGSALFNAVAKQHSSSFGSGIGYHQVLMTTMMAG